MPRRRLLITSVPLVLLTAGCRSADLFAGPDPLGARPPLAPDTVVLQSVIAAELDLIASYKAAMATSGNALLPVLAAQHRQHLIQLKAKLIVPSGMQPAAAKTAARGSAQAPGPHPAGLLRAAELASAASLTAHLVSVRPALAQLFASIAASDATHADALAGA